MITFSGSRDGNRGFRSGGEVLLVGRNSEVGNKSSALAHALDPNYWLAENRRAFCRYWLARMIVGDQLGICDIRRLFDEGRGLPMLKNFGPLNRIREEVSSLTAS